ncbi:MAG: carboxymuconolactone decarboxylase family protein [Acidobacteriaceae bacterium]
MQRIPALNTANAPEKTENLLEAVTKQMGGVPNILATMAQSGAALEGYLGFAGALAKGSLAPALREQIALAVAGANACDYCASVHTALGQGAKLSTDEMRCNLTGQSSDPKAASLLAFARLIVKERGRISDPDLAAFRAAGYDDEALVEVVAHVALNIFTNYFNHIAGTEVDFPLVNTESARV